MSNDSLMFTFDSRTRALLRGVWLHGTISAAAARIGMDPGNAARHLSTAERRLGLRLVDARRGGRGGHNARLTEAGRRFLQLGHQPGTALEHDPGEGVTPIRVGGRILYVGGFVPRGPVEISIRPETVAVERGPRVGVSSVRNRFPARVDRIEPASDGMLFADLSAGALRVRALIVKGALRDLRLQPGSRVYVNIKAVSIAAAPRND